MKDDTTDSATISMSMTATAPLPHASPDHRLPPPTVRQPQQQQYQPLPQQPPPPQHQQQPLSSGEGDEVVQLPVRLFRFMKQNFNTICSAVSPLLLTALIVMLNSEPPDGARMRRLIWRLINCTARALEQQQQLQQQLQLTPL